jgi:hypothetical protein
VLLERDVGDEGVVEDASSGGFCLRGGGAFVRVEVFDPVLVCGEQAKRACGVAVVTEGGTTWGGKTVAKEKDLVQSKVVGGGRGKRGDVGNEVEREGAGQGGGEEGRPFFTFCVEEWRPGKVVLWVPKCCEEGFRVFGSLPVGDIVPDKPGRPTTVEWDVEGVLEFVVSGNVCWVEWKGEGEGAA